MLSASVDNHMEQVTFHYAKALHIVGFGVLTV